MSNNVKISGKPEGQIDIKRLYLPGVTLTAKCPCGGDATRDFALECMYYPVMNEPFDVSVYCPNCNKTVTVQVMLKVSLKSVAPTG